MRHLLARLLERLPLDSRERRAVEETFADWQHEASLARSRFARAGVAATGFSINTARFGVTVPEPTSGATAGALVAAAAALRRRRRAR